MYKNIILALAFVFIFYVNSYSKEIIIGTEAKFPPFEYVENGKIIGFSTDLLTKIISNTGLTIKQFDVPFQGLLLGLKTGKFDYIISSMTATEDRDKKYLLSNPIADATVSLLVRKDSGYDNYEQLSGKVIGTQTGSTLISEINKISNILVSNGLQPLKTKEYLSFEEAYLDLNSKRIDGVFQAKSCLLYKMNNSNVFKIIDLPVDKLYFVWMCNKNNPQLWSLFNEQIKILKDSGFLYEIQKKWFGYIMEVPDRVTFNNR